MAQRTFWIITTLLLAGLFVQLFYFALTGPRMGGDSEFYLTSSDYPIYYLLYPALISILKHPIIIILFQIALQLCAGVTLYLLGKTIFHGKVGLYALGIFVLLFEIFQWNTYILTDSIFVSMLIFTTYFFVKKQYTVGVPLLITMSFLRPTVFPYYIALGIAFTWRWSFRYKIAIYAVASIFIVFSAWYILSAPAGPRLGVSGYIHYFASLFERGVIVRDRPSLIVPGMPFVQVVGARLVAFWTPVIPQFSLAHQALNICTLVPLYILGIMGISRTNYSYQKVLLLSIICSFWIFQVFTEVDYDWRYRIPVLPFLIIFAAKGFSILRDELQTS